MEVTLYDCYICKVGGTTGVCIDCSASLPSITNIKTETCNCDSIEEFCSCLASSSNPFKSITASAEYQAEYIPTNNGEQIVKISPATANVYATLDLYSLFLQIYFNFCDQFMQWSITFNAFKMEFNELQFKCKYCTFTKIKIWLKKLDFLLVVGGDFNLFDKKKD